MPNWTGMYWDIISLIRGASMKWSGRVIIATSRFMAMVGSTILRAAHAVGTVSGMGMKAAMKAAGKAISSGIKAGAKSIKAAFAVSPTPAIVVAIIDVASDLLISSAIDNTVLSFIPGSGLIELGMFIIDTISQIFTFGQYRPFNTKFFWQ